MHGDCRAALEYMPSNSIDSIVTDPPYALVSISKRFGKPGAAPAKDGATGVYRRASAGFMGKTWDNGAVAFDPEYWAEALRVLKPGGHVLAFGGTRTYHRLACAIEDGGFEIRDQIGWAFGSGFPKSHNQDGDWEGYGTALKPAWEPICMARKPLDGTNAQNLAKWGVGCLNIDGCRVEAEANRSWRQPGAIGVSLSGSVDGSLRNEIEDRSHLGRWPANLIHDGSDEVIDAFPHAPGQIADASTNSEPRKNQNVYGEMRRGRAASEPSHDSDNEGAVGFKMKPGARRADSGSAARFFYCAKASRSDRDDGLTGFEEKPLLWSAGTVNPGSFQSAGTKRAAKNPHPTVKPTELMRYLCRLVTPPGGTVLDPFMGSGSTGRGAVLEGFSFIGCEMDPLYVDIARARIAAVEQRVGVFA